MATRTVETQAQAAAEEALGQQRHVEEMELQQKAMAGKVENVVEWWLKGNIYIFFNNGESRWIYMDYMDFFSMITIIIYMISSIIYQGNGDWDFLW